MIEHISKVRRDRKCLESVWPRTLNIVGCYMLRPFALSVVRCCVLLGVVAQSLKPVKLIESTTPNNVSFVPWSPKRSPVLLNPLLGPRLVSLNINQPSTLSNDSQHFRANKCWELWRSLYNRERFLLRYKVEPPLTLIKRSPSEYQQVAAQWRLVAQ